MRFLLMVTLLGIAVATDGPYNGHSVYRMRPTIGQLIIVNDHCKYNSGYDIWKEPFELGDNMEIMVSPAQQNVFRSFLKNNSIDFSITVQDVQELIEKEAQYAVSARISGATGDISFTRYHKHSEISDYLKKLASNYPKLVTLETIGKSYEGRDLTVVKISSGGSDNRPAILIDSGIHAREWISPAMSLYIIHQLVENNTANRDLTESLDWYILPVVNPDGYEYSHADEGTQHRYWRKSRSPGPASHPECLGVDLNRNFEFKWQPSSGIYPCIDEVYPGAKGASEPETKALQDFALSKKNIKLYLTFHSFSNIIMHTWSYTNSLPSDVKTLQAVAKEANAAHIKAGGESYRIGTPLQTLGYTASGSSMDYMKGVAGIELSFAVELTNGYNFVFPAKLILSTVTKFFEPIRSFANYVMKNV